ncbi:hypothetical protein SALBM311S_12712 [Streptomyces alboniger]
MNRYVKVDPAGTAVWVTGGTPSMSLRRAMPCQWMDVAVLPGSWLDSSAARVSPAEIRISLPGVWPLKAQDLAMVPPPRSSMPGAAVRSRRCTLPVLLRFLSVRATWEPEGLRREGLLSEASLLQAASRPVPAAPSPASRRERRLMLFTRVSSSRCA